MFRTALRNVVAHKARLLMTMLAVMLGVAFVAGTLIFTGSVSDAYTRSSEQSFAHVDVRIRPVDTGESSGRLLDQDLLDRAGQLPGVASATGVVSGFAALAGPDGQMVGEGWATVGANHDIANGSAARYPMVEGRAPTAEGEIAIDARTAQRTGFRVGDTVRLSVSGPVVTERVTGIFTTDDGNVAAGGTLTLFDTATAQSLFARPGHYNHIELTADPATTPESLQQETARVIPGGLEAVTAAHLAQQQANLNASSFSALSQILLACAGLALFVGIFLIANTFTMLIAQRTKELALLRAVGASRRQVTRSVLVEAALVGLAASAAGLAIGAGVGAGVRALLVATGARLPDGPLVVDATTVLASLAIGVGVTCLAAWLPARHAAKIPPVAALTNVHAAPAGRSLLVRNVFGGVLAGTGAALVIAATFMSDGRVWLAIGAVLLLTGVFVLTPLLSRPVIAAAGPALRWFGVSGRLAGQNAVRNPRRTAATASALTIGLTLVTALTVIGAGADRATEELAGSDYLRADYIVALANAGPLGPGTERRLREVDGVTATSPRRETRATVGGVEQEVIGFRTESIGGLLNLAFTEGGFAPGDTAVVDTDTAAGFGWRVGDTVPVTWPDGASGALRLTGLYHSTIDGGVKTDISVTDPHLDRIADHEVYVKTERGPSEAMRRALQLALGDSPGIRISDKDDLVDRVTGTVGVILNILYGMLALAIIIAVLGVVNTLALSVHERTHEIGLLRAIGLDRSGVRQMVRLEAVVISLFGGVLGVGLGVLLGWAVGELVAHLVVDAWITVLPWGRLTLFLASAALVGVVAAIWPARRAARLNLLDAIRTE